MNSSGQFDPASQTFLMASEQEKCDFWFLFKFEKAQRGSSLFYKAIGKSQNRNGKFAELFWPK